MTPRLEFDGPQKPGIRASLGKRSLFRLLAMLGIGALAIGGCRHSSGEPVTVTYLDPEWSHDLPTRRVVTDAALLEFTRTTGIKVKHLPGPETSPDQLALTRDLLQKRAVSPDVYGVDVIWPGIVNDYLIDLKPYFTAELASEDPRVLENYTVQGKLVAMPYHANSGILFYRADLLQKYGFNAPPKTWDELEKMAVKIQAGERAKGEKDFWAFVWPGADSEGLTCLALEWQLDEGGGQIIESDAKVSVNNPDAIRAWERAARWVGWISPPSVISYQEWDASNAFWLKGRAAFFRGWTSDFFLNYPLDVPYRDQAGIVSAPGGKSARVATLGGFGLGISQSSVHREEAIRLVQFLVGKERQIEKDRAHTNPPPHPVIFDIPTILKGFAHLPGGGEKAGGGVAVRPSTITAQKYNDVSQAYSKAVHAVLTHQSTGPQAASTLEKDLVRITGFDTKHE